MKSVSYTHLDVYKRQYRIIVKEVQLVGLGELYARFQRIREKLAKLGVFDEERKREIPRYPKKIGIVTSPSGAVIQDIRNIALRRNPYVKLVLLSLIHIFLARFMITEQGTALEGLSTSFRF